MGILLAFAPFVVFAILNGLAGPAGALAAAAAVSAALIARDLLRARRRVKILEAGTFALFAGLALFTVLAGTHWSVIGVRLCVDAGLLVIVLASMVARRPFTLQYAREQVPPELWNRPEFIRTNYVITGVWALAFAMLVLTETALLYVPSLPQRAGVVAIILTLIGAVKFTSWYPERQARLVPAGPPAGDVAA
ncbi:MAG: hypothetical protein WDM85_18825 [Caulobacteraceae bacterium]